MFEVELEKDLRLLLPIHDKLQAQPPIKNKFQSVKISGILVIEHNLCYVPCPREGRG